MTAGRLKQRIGRFLRSIGIVLAGAAALAVVADRAFFRGHGFPPPHLKTPGLFLTAPAKPGTWALLVNGGIRPRKNYPRYWNNISLVYCSLKALGWQSIRVLDAGGAAGDPDRLKRAFLGMFSFGGLLMSPSDLDMDGAPESRSPATRPELERALADIGRRMRPGDTLFIFITDHGKLARVDGRLKPIAGLWGGRIGGGEFDRLLRASIPDSCWTAVLAAQCWGRWFLKDVTRTNTLLIAPGRPNWIWSSQDYSIFPQRFCEALIQKNVFTGGHIAADSDGDGRVTIREAFRSACARDHAPEWPLLWVSGDDSAMPDFF